MSATEGTKHSSFTPSYHPPLPPPFRSTVQKTEIPKVTDKGVGHSTLMCSHPKNLCNGLLCCDLCHQSENVARRKGFSTPSQTSQRHRVLAGLSQGCGCRLGIRDRHRAKPPVGRQHMVQMAPTEEGGYGLRQEGEVRTPCCIPELRHNQLSSSGNHAPEGPRPPFPSRAF